MKRLGAAIAVSTLLLLAACEGQADENLAAAAENGAAAIGEGVEEVADDAGNALDKAGDTIGNQAAKIENGVDLDVDVNTGNAAANTQ
jgi:hypothetical protein